MLKLDIRLKEIPEEGGLRRTVPYPTEVLREALSTLDLPSDLDDDIAASTVTADLDLSRYAETVNVHARLTGDLRLACARCLGEAHLPVDVPLRIVIGPEDLGAEDSLEDEVEYCTHDGEVIHLGNVLREALLLIVPMSALCREDCQGLCPVCGRNKNDPNQKDCGHAQSVPDPRLVALRDLKL